MVDLGFVGEPFRINPEILHKLRHAGFIPVIAPIGIGEDGQTYNINADTAAGAIAAAMKAVRLLLLTDVAGFLDKDKNLVTELSLEAAKGAIADGTAFGGMIPKLETCIDAVDGGVEGAVILDGRVPHAILLEIFTEGVAGTLIGKK